MRYCLDIIANYTTKIQQMFRKVNTGVKAALLDFAERKNITEKM